MIGKACLDAMQSLHMRGCGQPPLPKALQEIELGFRYVSLAFPKGVGKEAQWPLRGDGRVQLTQAARGGVAWIHETALPSLFQLFIEALEVVLEDQHLAADLDGGGWIVPGKLHGDGGDGAHIGGNVLALEAIASGRALHQSSSLVEQVHRHAIQLGLGAVCDGLMLCQASADALIEGQDILVGKGVVQGQHGDAMLHRGKGVLYRAAHALGG